MLFTDTHAHLHFPDFDEDRKKVVARLREAGVGLLINVGTDLESSEQSLALAGEFDFIYGAAGIHPNDTKDTTLDDIRAIEALLEHPRMVAIGEVGLDYYRDHSPKEKQREVLEEFLNVQHKIKKPLILHCRDAYEDLYALIKERGGKHPGVMHCFSSNRDTLLRFVDLGFYISFAGPLTYKKNDELREACKACPLDRLLLETDAPFLPPQTMRGKRNEPSLMIETARTAAELHGLGLEKLAEVTTANAKRLFGL